MKSPHPPIALTVAGSDSCGGAGLQADLKVFQRFGVHGASAVTLVTAQNTRGIEQWEPLAPELVRAQIDALARDLRFAAAKTGALGSAATVAAVAVALEHHGIGPLVVDPVLLAHDRSPLLESDALAVVRERLLPLAALVTPNLAEAEALLGAPVRSEKQMAEAARALAGLGARAVLVTGGHLAGPEAVDCLWDGTEIHRLVAPRAPGGPFHGTGCALSAAIAAGLALGRELAASVAAAKAFVSRALARAAQVGAGAWLLDHGA